MCAGEYMAPYERARLFLECPLPSHGPLKRNVRMRKLVQRLSEVTKVGHKLSVVVCESHTGPHLGNINQARIPTVGSP